MYLYWIVVLEIPVDKIIPLSKFLSQFSHYRAMSISNNDFPNGIATVYIKLKKEETDSLSEIFSINLLNTLFYFNNEILLYHTKEDEESWEFAHIPQKLKEDLKNNFHFDFMSLYHTGVLILGKDTGDFMIELLKIKSYLVNKGYKNAILLKLVKDIPNQSLSQKLRMWGLLCRFTIIIDRTPAGHLSEFEMLKSQETIIAILRPKNFRSTFMMESNPQNYLINVFEFNSNPEERLDEAIKWAEDISTQNQDYYKNKYPWRKDYFN